MRSFRRFYFLVVLATHLSACSPGFFSGDNVDGKVRDSHEYRRINTACAGMDLSRATLDVPVFRKLVGCFDANGGMTETAALVGALSDSELEPIVETLNRYVLSDSKWLYQLDRSYRELDRQQILVDTFEQFGRIISNDQFVSSGLTLLKTGYFSDQGRRKGGVLRAIEKIAAKLDDENVSDALDATLNVARSRVFRSVQEHFVAQGGRDLSEITRPLLQYLNAANAPGGFDAASELLNLVSSKEFFKVTDSLSLSDEAEIRSRVPRLASVMRATLAEHGQVFERMTSLFGVFQQPVRCFDSTQMIPQPAMSVLREIAARPMATREFLMRENLLNMAVAAPMCDFPGELASSYPALMDLAATRAAEPMGELMQALFKSEAAADLFIRFLSNSQNGRGSDAKLLLPFLRELDERGAWEDLLLLLTVSNIPTREQLASIAEFLVKPDEDLGGQSVYQVFSDVLSSTTEAHINAFIRSLHPFVVESQPLLAPALTSIRNAYHVNNVHPGVDVFRRIMAEASANRRLFDTLFSIAEKPQFSKAVREISLMSRPQDGRLKDLFGALVTLFHKFALQGEMPIVEERIPDFKASVRHELQAADLPVFDLNDPSADVFKGCRAITIGNVLGNPADPEFLTAIERLSACLNNDGERDGLAEAVQFFKDEKTNDGRSIIGLPIGWLREFHWPEQELRFLTDKALNAATDGRMSRLIRFLPLVAEKSIPVGGFWSMSNLFGSQTIFESLVNLAPPVFDGGAVEASARNLELVGANLLKRQEIPAALRLLDDAWPLKGEKIDVNDRIQAYDLQRIARWVGNKECGTLPTNPVANEKARQRRVRNIVEEFESAVTNVAVSEFAPPGHAPEFKVRTRWTKPEFKAVLQPMLDRLGDTDRYGQVIPSMMNFMKYFTLREGQSANQRQHYTPKYLREWLSLRANDQRLVSVAYPSNGQHPAQRRVRLLSTLDSFEVLLLGADIYIPDFQMNIAVSVLQDFADAWGDLPFEQWPEAIQRKYPKDGMERPKRLVDFVNDVESLVDMVAAGNGYPVLPGCEQTSDPSDSAAVQEQELYEPSSETVGDSPDDTVRLLQAGLYNVKMIIPDLRANLPDSGSAYAGGLSVMRDLLFELYYSSKPQDENNPDPDLNNLNLVLQTIRLGALRQVGAMLRTTSLPEKVLDDMVETLVAGAAAPELVPLAQTLFSREKEQRLVNGIVDQVWALGDKPENAQAMRQAGVYVLAAAQKMAGSSSVSSIVDPLIVNASKIVDTHYDYLSSRVDVLKDLIEWEPLPVLLKNIYAHHDASAQSAAGALLRAAVSNDANGVDLVNVAAAIDRNESSHASFKKLTDRVKLLKDLPEYRELKLDELGREVLDFLELRTATPLEKATVSDLFKFVAMPLENGDVHELVRLAARKPKDVERGVRGFAMTIGAGGMDRFFGVVGRYFRPKTGSPL